MAPHPPTLHLHDGTMCICATVIEATIKECHPPQLNLVKTILLNECCNAFDYAVDSDSEFTDTGFGSEETSVRSGEEVSIFDCAFGDSDTDSNCPLLMTDSDKRDDDDDG